MALTLAVSAPLLPGPHYYGCSRVPISHLGEQQRCTRVSEETATNQRAPSPRRRAWGGDICGFIGCVSFRHACSRLPQWSPRCQQPLHIQGLSRPVEPQGARACDSMAGKCADHVKTSMPCCCAFSLPPLLQQSCGCTFIDSPTYSGEGSEFYRDTP